MSTSPATDNTGLKVLVLEDSIRDMELMCEQLLNAGYHLDVKHAENEAGFTDSLHENIYDLILADFNLPGFDAFAALKICREVCPDTPFICVSGTIGEETAVELLKLGAVDYVLKERHEKLPVAVKRALEEAKVKEEYRKTVEALRNSEEMMRSSQSVAHICSYSTSLNVNEIEKSMWVCSPEFYKIFGINETYPHTIEGWANLIHPDYREKVADYHKSVVKDKKSFNREYKIIRTNDGAERWVHGTGELEFDEKGMPVRMHGAIQDITERKRSEMIKQFQVNIAKATITTKNINELFDSIKKELNRIIDATNIFIALYNEETGMLFSPLFRDEKDDFREWPANKSLTGYLIRQNRPLLLRKQEIEQLNAEGSIDLIGTTAEAWVGVPLKVEGKMLGAVVVQNYDDPNVYDHTSIEVLELVAHELSVYIDWKRSEEKATKLAIAVEQSSVSVLITDRVGSIEYVNPSFTELTGYTLEEVKGKNPNILKSGHHSAAFYKELWDTILSGNNWEGELMNRNKAGGLYWVKAVISPIVNSEGGITNFVSIRQDITERRRMLEELIAAKEKAEESDKLKTAFLQNISHEIRTPLNGILGFSELISDMNLSREEAKDMIKHIRQSSKRLTDTITDYIDMAMIVSGTMEVSRKEFPLLPLIEEAIRETTALHENRSVELKKEIPEQFAGTELYSDREIILKTISILLDNSLKFTSEGEITCGVRSIPDFMEFYIRDTGVGIEEEKLEVIFEMFQQADTSDTRGYEGSGLGLSIASGLVNLLGGSISVISEKGKGSTFSFTVPYQENKVTDKNRQAEGGKNKNTTNHHLVLLVEDDESSYLYLEMILKKSGYNYLLAKDGKEAVELCRQHPAITLVLMDIKMPLMNGEEATRIIHTFRPNLPIIATTAYAQSGDQQRLLNAGLNGYLAKPIKKEKLLALLQELR